MIREEKRENNQTAKKHIQISEPFIGKTLVELCLNIFEKTKVGLCLKHDFGSKLKPWSVEMRKKKVVFPLIRAMICKQQSTNALF